MQDKDAAVIAILTELGLRKEPELTADQEQLWKQAMNPDEQLLADMKKFMGEGEVVDFTSRLQNKQATDYQTRMQALADQIPHQFLQQNDIEQAVKDAVYSIEDKGACTKAIFKYPTLLSGYKKGFNPVKSIFHAYTDRNDPNHKFARQVVAHIGDKIVAAIDTDIAAFDKLNAMTKGAVSPHHPAREISGAIHDYTVMKNYFTRK